MAGPILYQPGRSWRSAAAFAAAALIHFAALALASIHQHEEETELPPVEDSFPPVVLTTEIPFDSTPPPDVADPPPSPNPTDELFPHEKPSPPPIRQQDRRPVEPIVKAADRAPGLLTLSSARVMALSAPRPEYPYEARRQKITGSGFVVMTIDAITGRVTGAVMEQSTGSPVLDNAAITGFRRWRFRPGTVSRVRSPITFTMTGAQY